MQKRDKWLLFGAVTLIVLALVLITPKIELNLRIGYSKLPEKDMREWNAFCEQVKVCLIYEGNIYYVTDILSMKNPTVSPNNITDYQEKFLEENYELVGKLQQEKIPEHLQDIKYLFHQFSMVFRIYQGVYDEQNEIVLPVDMVPFIDEAWLYYRQEDDTCLVCFDYDYDDRDCVGWFKRDDNRFAFSLSPVK